MVAETNHAAPPRRSRSSIAPQVSPARPEPLVVVQPGQGVGHGVEVGADVQAVEHGVVPGVDHGRHVHGRDDAHQAAEETGGTHSSGEGGDHGDRLTGGSDPHRRPGVKGSTGAGDSATRERASTGGRRRHAPARDENRGGSLPARAPWAPSPSARSTSTPSPCTWRRRRLLPPLVPAGVHVRQRAMPARPLHWAWAHGRIPAVEHFLGPADVVQRHHHFAAPTRRAGRVVTVHDLTTVRYPELRDRATLRFPRLVRRAVAEGVFVHTPSQFVADEVVASSGPTPDACASSTTACPWGARPRPRATTRRPGGRSSPTSCRRGRRVTSWPWARWSPARTTPGWCAPSSGWRCPIPTWPSSSPASTDGEPTPCTACWEASPRREAVLRLGYVADDVLAVWLMGAQVLAFPSVYEGFGFPPLEAMAGPALPVVASAAGVVPEIVGDGAVVVPGRDADVSAGALVSVLDDDAARGRVGATGTGPGGALHVGGVRGGPERPVPRRRRGPLGTREWTACGRDDPGCCSSPSSCAGACPEASAPTSRACSAGWPRWARPLTTSPP